MTRSLSITAAEWASITDGDLWLVREADICRDRRHYILSPSAHNPLGTRRNDVHDDVRCPNPCSNTPDGARRLVHQVPIEFVEACAPCETCGDSRCVPAPDCHCTAASSMNYSLCNHPPADCPDCRIKLVGPCPEPQCEDVDTLGRAYAVGQPLPIYSSAECFAEKGEYCIYVQQRGGYARLRFWPKGDDITDRLAHYGPPESLVGKWALRLAVES